MLAWDHQGHAARDRQLPRMPSFHSGARVSPSRLPGNGMAPRGL
jgi:hypothetical protein